MPFGRQTNLRLWDAKTWSAVVLQLLRLPRKKRCRGESCVGLFLAHDVASIILLRFTFSFSFALSLAVRRRRSRRRRLVATTLVIGLRPFLNYFSIFIIVHPFAIFAVGTLSFLVPFTRLWMPFCARSLWLFTLAH